MNWVTTFSTIRLNKNNNNNNKNKNRLLKNLTQKIIYEPSCTQIKFTFKRISINLSLNQIKCSSLISKCFNSIKFIICFETQFLYRGVFNKTFAIHAVAINNISHGIEHSQATGERNESLHHLIWIMSKIFSEKLIRILYFSWHIKWDLIWSDLILCPAHTQTDTCEGVIIYLKFIESNIVRQESFEQQQKKCF